MLRPIFHSFSAGQAFIAFTGLWDFGSRFFNRFSLAKVSSGKEPKFKLEATKSWGKLTQLGGLNVKERSRGFKVKNNLRFDTHRDLTNYQTSWQRTKKQSLNSPSTCPNKMNDSKWSYSSQRPSDDQPACFILSYLVTFWQFLLFLLQTKQVTYTQQYMPWNFPNGKYMNISISNKCSELFN